MKTLVLTILFVLSFAAVVLAWDGYDYAKGCDVEINSGNTVRSGSDIEVYDYCDGEYHDVTVDSIYDGGSSVTVEVTDNNTGEERTLEMDKRR